MVFQEYFLLVFSFGRLGLGNFVLFNIFYYDLNNITAFNSFTLSKAFSSSFLAFFYDFWPCKCKVLNYIEEPMNDRKKPFDYELCNEIFAKFFL